ncbi:MAG: hypothetical protein GXO79_01810 [Chlorobi bacterium]|nr:hypothetical protein [Chlorobiota bacterium]
METHDVNIEWIQKKEKKCLRLTINGQLDENIAKKAISKWREEFTFNLAADEKVAIICNCLNMTGYETNARKLWQQTINELKSQIDYMWIISTNTMFKTAAKTMGLLIRFKIKTANSESEIFAENIV